MVACGYLSITRSTSPSANDTVPWWHLYSALEKWQNKYSGSDCQTVFGY